MYWQYKEKLNGEYFLDVLTPIPQKEKVCRFLMFTHIVRGGLL